MIVKVVEASGGRRMITVADPEGSGESSSLADVGVVWWCSVRSMGICIAKVGFEWFGNYGKEFVGFRLQRDPMRRAF